MALSSQEFNDYGGFGKQAAPVEAPLPYNKSTRTSVGHATTWRRPSGTGISRQSSGSFLSFDDDSTTPIPESDKGSKYLRE